MARPAKRLIDPDEAGPERTCALTRQTGSPDAMIRFVLDPAGTVVPDIARKLPGRGVWLTASAHHVAEAARKGVFPRAFKGPAQVPGELPDLLDRLLERDALQRLSLAAKAGLMVSGAAKVEAAMADGAIAGLIHAADGAADGVRKIEAALTRNLGDAAAEVPRVNLFTSSQLDLALGRLNVIHAALKRGAAAEPFLTRCRRLADFRSDATTMGTPSRRNTGNRGQPSSDETPATPTAGDASPMTNGPSGLQEQR